MQLVLVHHGPALSPADDPLQPLSAAGRGVVETLGKRGASHGVKPAAVWHSGKLRARQTAEAWWRACHPFAEMRAVRGLQATESPRLARAAIDAQAADLVMVGHLPHLARLLASLLSGEPDGEAPFPVHGAVALRRDDAGAWHEEWRLDSEI